MNLGTRFDVYPNTVNNQRALGMHEFPEYVFGDSSAPYIMHDTVNGEFTYVPATFFDGLPAPSVWISHTKSQLEDIALADMYEWSF